jgi:hypothetical protein
MSSPFAERMLFADASAAIVPAAMATSPGGQVICFG